MRAAGDRKQTQPRCRDGGLRLLECWEVKLNNENQQIWFFVTHTQTQTESVPYPKIAPKLIYLMELFVSLWSRGLSPALFSQGRVIVDRGGSTSRLPCYVFCICLLTYTNKYHKYKSVELGDQLGVNKKMMKNRIIIFFAPVALLSTRYTEISVKSDCITFTFQKGTNFGKSFCCVQLSNICWSGNPQWKCRLKTTPTHVFSALSPSR